eukprot:scaffold5608_cov386-Prasinococcus_capsulatus_cf.AAC.7
MPARNPATSPSRRGIPPARDRCPAPTLTKSEPQGLQDSGRYGPLAVVGPRSRAPPGLRC